jgi:hypothetical protein
MAPTIAADPMETDKPAFYLSRIALLRMHIARDDYPADRHSLPAARRPEVRLKYRFQPGFGEIALGEHTWVNSVRSSAAGQIGQGSGGRIRPCSLQISSRASE